MKYCYLKFGGHLQHAGQDFLDRNFLSLKYIYMKSLFIDELPSHGDLKFPMLFKE